jgi:hypothetical protein
MAPAKTNQNRGRILRIGVLLGGKIVEERLIRDRISVSVGQSMKNTFSVPVDGLPLEFTLFALDQQGKYWLRFLPRMDGRISDATSAVNTLDQLRQKGAQNVGEYYQVALGDSSRGKLTIGDLTVLFQFVTEPPRQPRPMLPASVRGTFADRFDPRLSVIMGSSIIAHFAIVIFALLMDVDNGDSTADRAYNLTFKPETYTAEIVVPQDKPQEKAEAGSAAPEKAKEPEKKAPERVVPTKAPTPDPDAGRKAAEAVAMKEEQAKALASALVSDDENGTQQGGMNKRRPGADLGQQLADVREGNKQITMGNNSGRGSRGNGDPKTGTGHGPGVDVADAGGVGSGKAVESNPIGRISVSSRPTGGEGTTLSAETILAKINGTYMPQIKRCYNEYLKKDAAARGKVTLAFTVNSTGRLVNGTASGMADEVDACIGKIMGGWTFPKPKDKDGGDAAEAEFALGLQLLPPGG